MLLCQQVQQVLAFYKQKNIRRFGLCYGVLNFELHYFWGFEVCRFCFCIRLCVCGVVCVSVCVGGGGAITQPD